MMIDNIRDLYKNAILEKNEDRKRTIGNLISAMKNKEIELRAKQKELSTSDVLDLVQKSIKQNNEAIVLFKQGKREDLVKKLDVENAILQTFLPKQLSETETEEAIKAIILTTGATSIKDMGKVMAQMKEKYSGQIDMGSISAKIKQLLS